MKIEPFVIKVTPEQSKIIQEIIFKNGYSWADRQKIVQYIEDDDFYYEYLLFQEYNRDPDDLVLRCTKSDIPTITFDEFINKYNLKEIRNKKLKILQNDNDIYLQI